MWRIFFLLFLFNLYQNCIARVIFISEKNKQERAKQRQVEEALRIIPIMTFFQFSSECWVLDFSLKIVILKKNV